MVYRGRDPTLSGPTVSHFLSPSGLIPGHYFEIGDDFFFRVTFIPFDLSLRN